MAKSWETGFAELCIDSGFANVYALRFDDQGGYRFDGAFAGSTPAYAGLSPSRMGGILAVSFETPRKTGEAIAHGYLFGFAAA